MEPANSQLEAALINALGESQGKMLSRKYANTFPQNYFQEYPLSDISNDILCLEELSSEKFLTLRFYQKDGKLHLKIFQRSELTALSDILPILEKFGLFVIDKLSYPLSVNSITIWVSDYSLSYQYGVLEVNTRQNSFKEALTRVWLHQAENDYLNSLIISANLEWYETTLLRAYVKYWQQLGSQFSQPYIEKTLVKYASISNSIIELFKLRFELNQNNNESKVKETEGKILHELDKITSIDDDRILRTYLNLIKATVRTNYFQNTYNDLDEKYIVLKFSGNKISEFTSSYPEIDYPEFETFVYSPRFEAIHLRSSKIARGGIRWSDRHEDFRTEIYALMRTQIEKNSLIVPTGAKGGFVLKRKLLTHDFKSLQAEAISCYKMFISGLLDITDNRLGREIIPPTHVICHDGNDPYLVVAADKGTASFSDIANELAREYRYWLDDAFASGGVTGYDHKKMGITSNGAWESVKRHFLEADIDINVPFSVIGIGDMSGDVFGNGLLYSRNIRLIAAFDHRHIFIDPDPDPNVSYEERLRLFHLPFSSWQDYNTQLISKGGGIFSRSVKKIKLTPEIKQALRINEDELTPTEIIRYILKAPVDLFWNGGIGTFVKSSHELNESVGDHTNDYIRINAKELRCKVVGEGGNLGFTQLARVEYAAHGGKINTDFIDNVGGVDCSDREVNIKIALNTLVAKNKLTEEQRNNILADMTDEVKNLVLKDAYNQALAISIIALRSITEIELYQNYIKEQENRGRISREAQCLPDDEELLRRSAAKRGLFHPEIAVLLAYTKIFVKKEILDSKNHEGPYFDKYLKSFFPPKMLQPDLIDTINHHQLKNEIIATRLSDELINRIGIISISNLHEETGADIGKIINAYVAISNIFCVDELYNLIESLDNRISVKLQYQLYVRVQDLIHNGIHWFLHNHESNHNITGIMDNKFMKQVCELIPELMVGATREYMTGLIQELTAAGLSNSDAKKVASCRAWYSGLNIVDIFVKYKLDLKKVTEGYLAVGEHFNLVQLRDRLFTGITGNYWDNLSRTTLRDELDTQQRNLTVIILKDVHFQHDDTYKEIKSWMERNCNLLSRWDKFLTNLKAIPNPDFTIFFILVNELKKISQNILTT